MRLFTPKYLVREYMGVSCWNADGQQRVENTIEVLALVRIHPTNLRGQKSNDEGAYANDTKLSPKSIDRRCVYQLLKIDINDSYLALISVSRIL